MGIIRLAVPSALLRRVVAALVFSRYRVFDWGSHGTLLRWSACVRHHSSCRILVHLFAANFSSSESVSTYGSWEVEKINVDLDLWLPEEECLSYTSHTSYLPDIPNDSYHHATHPTHFSPHTPPLIIL